MNPRSHVVVQANDGREVAKQECGEETLCHRQPISVEDSLVEPYIDFQGPAEAQNYLNTWRRIEINLETQGLPRCLFQSLWRSQPDHGILTDRRRNTHVTFTNDSGEDVVGVVKGHSVRQQLFNDMIRPNEDLQGRQILDPGPK